MTPVYRPIGDAALLVEFGQEIDDAVHNAVIALDGALKDQPIEGGIETIPAYTSLLVRFDPLVTDHPTVEQTIAAHVQGLGDVSGSPTTWEIPACYEGAYAPDIGTVAEQTGLSTDDIATQHANAEFKVYMYGFAPGFAYMGGVPAPVQLPRRKTPIKDVPIGSILIAGKQCLITTLDMPTGWWIIGRAARTPLNLDADQPFLFGVGDRVKFVPVAAGEFGTLTGSDGE